MTKPTQDQEIHEHVDHVSWGIDIRPTNQPDLADPWNADITTLNGKQKRNMKYFMSSPR